MRSIAILSFVVLLSAAISTALARPAPAYGVSGGDPVEGKALFTKLRCDSCHATSTEARRVPHPLPDLTAQPPDAVAWLITDRGQPAKRARFEEMVMSTVVSQMTPQDLGHLVAFLRNPAPRSR